MKHLFTILLSAIITGSILTSCNEKVDLVGDFTETAVVYGLLDQSDSIHFIKITRAFIGPGNSLEISKIPDSSYFNQIDATVSEFKNGTKIREWVLRDTLIDNKETDGVFYAPTQKVYYFATKKSKADGTQQMNSASSSDLLNSLDKDATYKLHISLNGGAFEVNGETDLVRDISVPSFSNQVFQFNFVDNKGYTATSMTSNYGNSYIFNSTLQVTFEEINTGVDTTKISFLWKLGEKEVLPGPAGSSNSVSFTMNGRTFYELILSHCTSNSSINKRRLHSIKLINTGGSEDLYNYMLVNQPSSSLAQNKPTFTNLEVSEGHRAIGLFSARNTFQLEKLYYPSPGLQPIMNIKSRTELCVGVVTGLKLFCSQHPADSPNNGVPYCP